MDSFLQFCGPVDSVDLCLLHNLKEYFTALHLEKFSFNFSSLLSVAIRVNLLHS